MREGYVRMSEVGNDERGIRGEKRIKAWGIKGV